MVKYNQESYEKAISRYIENFIEILNVRLEFTLSKDEIIKIYKKILDIVPPITDSTKFQSFYFYLGKRKNPKYLAAALIYQYLFSIGKQLSQAKLGKMLGLHTQMIGESSRSISDLIKKILKKNGYHSIPRPKKLGERRYTENVFKYIKLQLRAFTFKISFKFTNDDINSIKEIYYKAIDSINFENYNKKFETFYNLLYRKQPAHLAAVLCYIYIKYCKDVEIYLEDYIEIINEDKKYQANITILGNMTSKFTRDFYKNHIFKESIYRKKTLNYLKIYLKRLKKWIYSNKKRLERNYLINHLDLKFIANSMEIYDNAISNKFQIIYINEHGEVFYYYPQLMALSLIFYGLKTTKELGELATIDKFKSYFDEDRNYGYISNITVNRLYPYVKHFLGRLKYQKFTRKSFIKYLKQRLKRFYHLESALILKIFEFTDFSFKEFCQKINVHGGKKTASILNVIKKRVKFTDPQTFENIRKFIKSHISGSVQKDLLLWVSSIQERRQKDFIDRKITYSFKWEKNRIKNISNRSLADYLYKFLSKIENGKYPQQIFSSNSMPRVSMLKLIGEDEHDIKSKWIKRYFSDKMILHSTNHFLCEVVKKVYQNYHLSKVGEIPDHPAIMKEFLDNNRNVIATEVLVWKKIKNSRDCFLGQIDLIYVLGNTLFIAEYKPSINKIYKSLPQFMGYGILVQECLKEFGDINSFNIRCIGFSSKFACEFNPDNLKCEMTKFIELLNKKRGKPLKSQKLSKNSKRTDLLEDLRKLIL